MRLIDATRLAAFAAAGLLASAGAMAQDATQAAPASPAPAELPAPAATPAPATPEAVQANAAEVHAGPPQVRLQLDTPLSSVTSVTGQKFKLTVVEDVFVDGKLVVPKGAQAQGTVLFARRKGFGGRSGALDLRVDYVETPEGRLRIKAALDRRGLYKTGQAVAMQAFFGILGAMTVQSNDVQFEPGTRLTADLILPPAGATPAPGAAPVAVPAAVAQAPAETPAATADAAPAGADATAAPASAAAPAAATAPSPAP